MKKIKAKHLCAVRYGGGFTHWEVATFVDIEGLPISSMAYAMVCRGDVIETFKSTFVIAEKSFNPMNISLVRLARA